MRYGDSLSLLSLASLYSRGISLLSLAHGRPGGGHVWVNWLNPRAPIECNKEHAQFVDVSEVNVMAAYSSVVSSPDPAPKFILGRGLGTRLTVARCNSFHEGRGM